MNMYVNQCLMNMYVNQCLMNMYVNQCLMNMYVNQLLDSEKVRESLQKDVAMFQRHLVDGENQSQMKDKEFQMVLEERARTSARLEDQRRQVESMLEASKAELSDNRLKLSASEGRVVALESKLAEAEADGRDVEMKLASIVSTLRRTIGFNPRSTSKSRARSLSPKRALQVPTKGQRRFLILLFLFL